MVVLAWLSGLAPSRAWQLLVGTGFCGALTTFSALQVEAITLARDGHAGLALGYASSSLFAGMALAAGVTMLVRRRRHG